MNFMKNYKTLKKKLLKKPEVKKAYIGLNKIQLEVLERLKILWEKYPEERFGQLLFNHTRIGTHIIGKDGFVIGIKDPFFYQDEDILKDLK
jgi:hypothetical protein